MTSRLHHHKWPPNSYNQENNSLQLAIMCERSACDMDMCPGKYICMDQSSNKGIYKDYVKKDIQCSFKTMNIDVLGKFHKGILS